MSYEFDEFRVFNPLTDKITELPLYDQLDWLIIFFTSPGYWDGASILQVCFFVRGMSIGNDNLAEPPSLDLIEHIKLLVVQLLEDKYLIGDNPFENEDNHQIYKATLKAKLVLEGIGGYRHTIWEQKLEKRNAYRIQKNSITTNNRLVIIYVFATFFAFLSVATSWLSYKLAAKLNAENNLTKEAQSSIAHQDSLLRERDLILIRKENMIDSLLIRLYGKNKP